MRATGTPPHHASTPWKRMVPCPAGPPTESTVKYYPSYHLLLLTLPLLTPFLPLAPPVGSLCPPRPSPLQFRDPCSTRPISYPLHLFLLLTPLTSPSPTPRRPPYLQPHLSAACAAIPESPAVERALMKMLAHVKRHDPAFNRWGTPHPPLHGLGLAVAGLGFRA